jgi:hypothetical protein
MGDKMKKTTLIILILFMFSLYGCKTENISSGNSNSTIAENISSGSSNSRITESIPSGNSNSTIMDNNASSITYIHVNVNALNEEGFNCTSGDITEDNNYIYNCTKAGINKIDKKNGKSKLISKQVDAGDLVLSGKYLYFLTEYGDNKGIFRVDTNGNSYSQVFDGKQIANVEGIGSFKADGNIGSFKVDGNKLYIKSVISLFSFDMISGKLKLLSDDVEEFEIVNEYLYYIDHAEKTFTIYKKNLNDMKTEILLGNGISKPGKNYYDEFLFLKGNMYYSTHIPNGIHIYNNGKSTTISNKEHEYILALLEYRGDMYYVINGTDKKNKLMKYNAKNNSSSQVAELKGYGESYGLRIVNGYAYYSTADNEAKSVRIKE